MKLYATKPIGVTSTDPWEWYPNCDGMLLMAERLEFPIGNISAELKRTLHIFPEREFLVGQL